MAVKFQKVCSVEIVLKIKGVNFQDFLGLKTPPETNSTSPRENQWLEKDPFRGKLLALGEG